MKMKTLKELKVGNDKSYKDALKKYLFTESSVSRM